MRIVVLGAGAVGGVVGACLHRAGHEVTLVARGEHLRAVQTAGLRLATPDGATVHHIDAVAGPENADLDETDLLLLSCKSQDTAAALGALAASAPADLAVACLQNGIENERTAQRWFAHIYGVAVMCPTAFLEPGHVIAYASPVTGILDVGRYPEGVDGLAHELAGAFRAATFASEARADILRWKRRKLIINTGNAVEALAGPYARAGEAGHMATDEAEQVLAGAGMAVASRDEDRNRRGELIERRPVEGVARPGGSMWQSLARAAGSTEVDFINGEVVRIARAHGLDAPVNARLQHLCHRAVVEGWGPAAVDPAALVAELRAAAAR